MKDYRALSFRGQIKIQQMAFVLVAFVLFFALVAVFYFSIKLGSLREEASTIRHEQAQAVVKKLSSTAEFSWTVDDCSSCVDLDKVFALKNRTAYKGFWGNSISLIQVRKIYPYSDTNANKECNSGNYPNCNLITLLSKNENYTSDEAFVALCRFDADIGVKCELGKIILGVKST